MKTLDEIKDEVATWRWPNLKGWGKADSIQRAMVLDEVCKRYARECCIATLEKASENGKIQREKMDWYLRQKFIASETFFSTVDEFYQIDKSSITNPDNIVL